MALPLIGGGLVAIFGTALRSAVGWAITGLGRLMSTRIGQWGAALLGYFGLAFATQTVVMGPVISQLQAHMQGVSGDAVAWLGYLNFDKACTMILSALAVRFGLQSAKVFLARR